MDTGVHPGCSVVDVVVGATVVDVAVDGAAFDVACLAADR